RQQQPSRARGGLQPVTARAQRGPVLRPQPRLQAGGVLDSNHDARAALLPPGQQSVNRALGIRDGVAGHDEAAALAAVDHLVLASAVSDRLQPDEEWLPVGRTADRIGARALLEADGLSPPIAEADRHRSGLYRDRGLAPENLPAHLEALEPR